MSLSCVCRLRVCSPKGFIEIRKTQRVLIELKLTISLMGLLFAFVFYLHHAVVADRKLWYKDICHIRIPKVTHGIKPTLAVGVSNVGFALILERNVKLGIPEPFYKVNDKIAK
jgi:hypothetical protein